jgi:hypothetical protein
MKRKILKHSPIFLATYTRTMYRNLAIFYFFFLIMVIGNFQKYLILPLLIFNITFWLYIASKKEDYRKSLFTYDVVGLVGQGLFVWTVDSDC